MAFSLNNCVDFVTAVPQLHELTQGLTPTIFYGIFSVRFFLREGSSVGNHRFFGRKLVFGSAIHGFAVGVFSREAAGGARGETLIATNSPSRL